MNRSKQSYIYAGVAVLFWSTIPTAFKIGLQETNVITLLTISTFTSTAVLFLIIVSVNKLPLLVKTSCRELIASSLLGLINPFIYYIILLKAYSLLPGQVAQPLNMIWPIILVFLSVPFLKQKIPARSFIALFISFAGVYIVSSQGHPLKPGSSDPLGVLLATSSSLFWALYFIFNVRDKRDEAVKLFTNFLFASVYLIAAMTITDNWHSGISLKGTGTSIYVGIFEMGITFYFWLKALSLAETSDKISNLVYIAPFLSMVLLYFVVKEPVYYTTPIGLIFIISGILLQKKSIQMAR
ncbi:MAG: DMT family transporter [Bacteroidales bacterium]